MSQTSLCFVSFYAYPLFQPTCRKIFGGSEVRAVLFGVGLSQCSEYDVSFVVFDQQQPAVETYAQVKVYRHPYYAYPPEVPSARGQTARWQRLVARAKRGLSRTKMCQRWRQAFPRQTVPVETAIPPQATSVYAEINADIYCGFGVSPLMGIVASFCNEYGKKFVFFSGSDADFDLAYHQQGAYMQTILTHAQVIITQTTQQARLLQERFARNAITIANPVDLTAPIAAPTQGTKQDIALWIGKSDTIKCPERLLALAQQFPHSRFVMVLNLVSPDIFEDVVRHKPANVTILNWVSFSDIDTLFARALVLVNTSTVEGFPNTFLQAGKYGVPILSLHVDPDGFIRNNACGLCAQGNMTDFTRGFATLWCDTVIWHACSENIRRYVRQHHDLRDKLRELRHAIA